MNTIGIWFSFFSAGYRHKTGTSLLKADYERLFLQNNINCLGCVHQIKPYLDKLEQDKTIEHWHVNLNSPEFLLQIETNKLSAEETRHIIEAQGYEADFVKAAQAK